MSDHGMAPSWLRDLVWFAGVVAAVLIPFFAQKSDLRSAREEMMRISGDVSAIRASMPNRERIDDKIEGLTIDLKELKDQLELEELKREALERNIRAAGVRLN